ncbi:MAG: hypothetical protein J1D86_07870 [Alistipes sp.]|nr:hypothetical protein [Alistipes sp.]
MLAIPSAAITGISAAEQLEQLPVSIHEPMLAIVLSYVCPLLVVLLSGYIGYKSYRHQRNISNKQISHRLTAECTDLIRHINAGLGLLANQHDRLSKLSPMHFRKMKISDISLFFDHSFIHNYPARHDTLLRKCSLLLRNYNIELDAVIEAAEDDAVPVEKYAEYVDYFCAKCRILIKELFYVLCRLTRCDCDYCRNNVPVSLHNDDRHILYKADGQRQCILLNRDTAGEFEEFRKSGFYLMPRRAFRRKLDGEIRQSYVPDGINKVVLK